MRAPTVTEEAAQTAKVTAERARVRIETVGDPRRLVSVTELFASVWGSGPGQEPIAADLLRALAHSGGAVHVAFGRSRARRVRAGPGWPGGCCRRRLRITEIAHRVLADRGGGQAERGRRRHERR